MSRNGFQLKIMCKSYISTKTIKLTDNGNACTWDGSSYSSEEKIYDGKYCMPISPEINKDEYLFKDPSLTDMESATPAMGLKPKKDCRKHETCDPGEYESFDPFSSGSSGKNEAGTKKDRICSKLRAPCCEGKSKYDCKFYGSFHFDMILFVNFLT